MMVLKTMNGRVINQLTAKDVEDIVSEARETDYKTAGEVENFSDIPALTSSMLGNVYNVKNDFTTNAYFLEGAGVEVPGGTNVVVVKNDNGDLRFDLIATESHEYATDQEVNDVLNGIYKD